MGQYFAPVLVDHNDRPVAALRPSDYGSGEKLGGHSRADAPLMIAVETLLILDGGGRLAWAGDYDGTEDGELGLYWAIETHHFVRLPGLIDPDAEDTAPNPDAHQLTAGTVPLPEPTQRWICNPQRREYIDKLRLIRDEHGVHRSPLPALTAEGGPARGRTRSWARHRIYLTDDRPRAGWTDVSNINHL